MKGRSPDGQTWRHWHIEVRRGFKPWSEESAGGWRASGERIQ